MRKLAISLMISLLFVIGIAQALTWVTPTNGGTIRGATYVLNITNSTNSMDNLSNCTVSASSTLTSDTLSDVVLVNNTYATGDNWVNYTINTYSLLDATDWVFSSTCTNHSMDTETMSTITVTVDNSIPTCVFASGLNSNTEYSTTQSWVVTGTNATSATIEFFGFGLATMTESSSTADEFSYAGPVTEGNYNTVTVTTSDGTNTTSCSRQNIIVDDTVQSKKVTAIASAGKKGAQPTNNNALIGVVLAGLGALYLINKKK